MPESNIAVNLIKNLHFLGHTYPQIAIEIGLSKTTIGRMVRGYRSGKKGSGIVGRKPYKPNAKTINKIVKNVGDIETKSNFYAEAIAFEKIRRAKSKEKIGNYIAGEGRTDERDCFKINRKVLFRNKEKMYEYIKNLIRKNYKIWKKRGDYLFYIRAYGHLSLSGERRELSVPTPYCNDNLKNATECAFEIFVEKFERFIDRDYADMWLVTDITVCGAHFTLFSFDKETPKKFEKKKTGRKVRRKQIQKRLS